MRLVTKQQSFMSIKHTNIAKTYKRICHVNFYLAFTILIKVLSLINKINIDISKLHKIVKYKDTH